MDIINPDIDEYLGALLRDDDPVVAEMEALADERGFPIVGPQVGRLLQVLALSIGARRVLELGSGYGYSALFFARALGKGGKVVMTEYDEGNARRARNFLGRAGVIDRVDLHVGDGLQHADELDRAGERFDIVFNDSEKDEYPKALDVARKLLRPGGLFICDNMLWYGRVVDPDPDDADTAGIMELTKQLMAAEEFTTTLLPVRDGVTVSVRKSVV